MDRRDSIKSIFVGTLGAGAVVTGCSPTEKAKLEELATNPNAYGRTGKEKARDEKLRSEVFFNTHEIDTLSTLCDLILPAADGYKAASEAEVTDFIEFMAKDISKHQIPLRGGIMWLDNFSNESFGLEFKVCSTDQQKKLLDQIAYPEEQPSEFSYGVEFFSLIRNLTITGFYTSKIGLEELGYKGNTPNVWDGVPDEVLKKHGFEYENVNYVDQSRRNDQAMWDDEGNLLS